MARKKKSTRKKLNLANLDSLSAHTSLISEEPESTEAQEQLANSSVEVSAVIVEESAESADEVTAAAVEETTE
ncbi:MAG TPA: hypothetical protein DDZ80_22310, partial [Cyanobacteria bacterium UBA8803]|nr:hypothetical protein [Cyanobacteria bacterium UBA9273]HBL61062.1 hypothetical protein [Cyanobacteria bacterium UBA8803]